MNVPAEKWQPVPCGGAPAEYEYKDGSRFAKYSVARSELLITDTAVQALDSRDVPDTSSILLRKRMVEELRRSDSTLANRFYLVNLERVNRQDSGEKQPKPAYVYGRHVRERDGRLVLGTSSQVASDSGKGSAKGISCIRISRRRDP